MELEPIIRELRAIKLLLAKGELKNLDNKGDKILFLSNCGIDNREVADLLETSLNTVQVAISRAKSAKNSKGKKKRSPKKEMKDGES